MKKWNLIVLFVCSCATVMGQWTQMGATIDDGGEYENAGESVSLDSIGNTLVIGAPYRNINKGYVKVVDWDGTSWIQRGNIIIGDTIYDFFGSKTSVSADGNIFASTSENQVSVYKWDGTTWDLVGNPINGNDLSDGLGSSVSLNAAGTTIACGGTNHSTTNFQDVGLVQIFDWNGSSWIQRGIDIEGISEYDRVGSSVSLSRDGNTVVIGAYTANFGVIYGYGKTMVYDWNGTSWVQRGTDIWGENEDEECGISVDIDDDGNSIIIASTGNYSKVFDWIGSSWVQRGLGIDENDPFQAAEAVAMSADGNSVIIGVPYNDNASGIAAGKLSIFDWNGASWVKRDLDILGETAGLHLGNAVSMSADGKIVACGRSYWNSVDFTEGGSASVYTTAGYTVGLSEISFPKFSAFPNPTKGNLTIELGQRYEFINLRVDNMLGQTVLIENYKDIDRIELDLDIEEGMYLIEIIDPTNSKSHFNIIKGN